MTGLHNYEGLVPYLIFRSLLAGTKEMRYRTRDIGLLMVLALLLMSGSKVLCKTSNKPAVLLADADQCRKSLYRSPEKKKFRHNWLRCIKRYKTIYKRYPKSDQAAWSLYHSARLYTGLY